MTQQQFDDLIGEPPPSTIDVAGIIRREKRQRRAPLVLVAVLTAVLGLTYAVAQGGDPARAPSQAVSPDAPSAVVGTGQDFRLVVNTKAAAQISKQNLANAILEAVRRTAPAAHWDPALPLVKTLRQGGGLSGPSTGESLFGGSTALTVGARTGIFLVSVEDLHRQPAKCADPKAQCHTANQAAETGKATFPDCTGQKDCTLSTGPKGLKMLTQSWSFPDKKHPNPWQAVDVRIQLAGGRMLYLELQNAFRNVWQDRPPLTTPQMQAVASEIANRVVA